jgi:O-glycosyl hydrolase
VNLTVDAAQGFQTIQGLGMNINANSWRGGELKPALDLLVDQNGGSMFRVLRDPMDWVASESDIAPLRALDAATLTRIYEAPQMQDIWNTIGYLNQKGLRGNQITLNFCGWTPTWLGGSGAYGSVSTITAGKEPEFATMVASLVFYARRVKDLDFTLLAPMNEPDWDGKEGPQLSPTQYVTALKALITELDAMGLTEVRLVGPDTAFGPYTYVQAMMGEDTVAGRVDHLAFHTYGSTASPWNPYAGKDDWLTETAQWCSVCDSGGSIAAEEEWGFARDSNDIILQDLDNGFPVVLLFEGYDSFYYHHDGYSRWGLLAYDTMRGVYTPRKRFYVNGQLTAFIRPGAEHIAVNHALGGLEALAFYDAAKGTIAIVGHNTGDSPVAVDGLLSNLPATSSLVIYQTDSGHRDLQRGLDVPVVNQSFAITIPADTFFSMANFTPPLIGIRRRVILR